MNLVDTDVLIDVWRGHPPALEWFAGCGELPAVPGIVLMELIQNAGNAQQVQQARKLVAPLQVVWPSEADCEQSLAYFVAYHLSHGLGLLDAMIAACATGHGPRGDAVHVQRQALPFPARLGDRAAIPALMNPEGRMRRGSGTGAGPPSSHPTRSVGG